MNTNLIALFIIVPVLALVLLGLNFLLAPHNPDESKISPYECGFLPHLGQTRSAFSIHFFKVGIFFLLFDMEILVLYPMTTSLSSISTYGFSIGMIFFIILTIGFILEVGSGAIALTEINPTSTN